jgi:hypothetical protein
MDYHWDHHLYFVISPHHTQTMTHHGYLLLIPIVAHTSTPTSSIWLMTCSDSLLGLVLVASVAFQVPILVVSAWCSVLYNLYQ